ncbi:MAG: arabinogalactan endo-beta-1,4-galactanase [Succinivibrio sp.]
MKKTLSVIATTLMALSLAACTSAPAGTEKTPKPAAEVTFSKVNLPANFIKGADASELLEMEESGFVYLNKDGVAQDCLEILKDSGINYIRLRLWVDPYDENGNTYGAGHNDLKTTLALAKRVKALGLKFLLDFHYSDFWTDPGKQIKPKAWEKLSFADLNTAIKDYTKETIETFKKEGAMPDMVQIGNEINSGILWPDGKSWGGDGHEFDRLAELLKSAISGFNEAKGDAQCPVMLHLAKGPDNGMFKWWFGEITARNVPFDIVGMSMYTWWDGKISALEDNIRFVRETYGKDVIVVEGSYPYTLESKDSLPNDFCDKDAQTAGYEPTVAGQYTYLKDLLTGINNAGGNGFFYWGTTWKTGKDITWGTEASFKYIGCDQGCSMGNARENQALFDDNGKVLPSINVFNN